MRCQQVCLWIVESLIEKTCSDEERVLKDRTGFIMSPNYPTDTHQRLEHTIYSHKNENVHLIRRKIVILIEAKYRQKWYQTVTRRWKQLLVQPIKWNTTNAVKGQWFDFLQQCPLCLFQFIDLQPMSVEDRSSRRILRPHLPARGVVTWPEFQVSDGCKRTPLYGIQHVRSAFPHLPYMW